jgi:hypothetical protein
MDGDGYADLVVGASGATAGGVRGAGSVTVVFGTRTGLSHRAIGFHAPAPSPRGGFGGQLAMADFNHDGLRDLVVVDGKQVALVPGANNLRATGARDVTLRVPPGGGGGTQRIAAGDIDGDGFDDLVTVAFDDDPADEGTLAVLPGSGKGLRDKPLGQKIPLPFASYTPVVGDIDADGKDDVIIDTGFTDGPADAVLRTYPGGANGLRAGNAVSWKGAPHYGRTARLGDFDGDGHADLVVSDTKADARDGFHDAGAIVVAPGSTRWLNGSRARTITLDAEKVVGAAEAGDRFGSTLGLGDYDGDGTTDVAVGAPGKGKGVGAVGVLYGGAHGLSADRSILFGPDSLRADEAGASFGAALGG